MPRPEDVLRFRTQDTSAQSQRSRLARVVSRNAAPLADFIADIDRP